MSSKKLSPVHAEARRLAQAGVPVFPCTPNGKRPAADNGFKDATTNLAQIDRWWGEADYNLAFSPVAIGQCVIDLDGPEGETSWANLEFEHGAVVTREVRTPRGRHLYFLGDLPPTASKIAENVDTRGRGSYVLVPPSSVDGLTYEVVNDTAPAEIPGWVTGAIAREREHAKAAVDVELDLSSAIDRARSLLRDYVSAGDVAISGRGGDNRTYALSAEVLNLGLSAGKALELIEEHWNPRCVPPWDSADLAVKIENASRYAQNEAGAWAVQPALEVFGAALDPWLRASKPAVRSRFYPLDESEQDNLQEPAWLIKDLIPDRSTIMFYGASGSFKSFLALDLGLTLAAGLPGWGAGARDPMAVVYLAGEGPRSVSRHRRPAWRIARGVQEPLPFYLIPAVPMVGRPEDFQETVKAIEDRNVKPGLIVMDTVANAMTGMNENDARDASLLVAMAEGLKTQFACSVLAVHHTGKDSHRGVRGSSALYAGFDAVHEVERHEKTKAVAVRCRKQKDADERETPWTFEGKTVAASLVFFETDTAAYHVLTSANDVFQPGKVGAALTDLKAIGKGNAVTTNVLAAHMFPPDENLDAEANQENLGRRVAQLRFQAKGR